MTDFPRLSFAIRRIAPAVLTAVILLGLPRPANACSCRPLPEDVHTAVEQAAAEADAVFSGTVTARQTSNNRGGQIQESTVSVDRVWKGAVPNQVVFRINTTCCMCGMALDPDQRYLFFAWLNKDRTWSTNICSLTQPLDEQTDTMGQTVLRVLQEAFPDT